MHARWNNPAEVRLRCKLRGMSNTDDFDHFQQNLDWF
jgi:hypothetical protein